MTKSVEVRRDMVDSRESLGVRTLKSILALAISRGMNAEEKAFELVPLVDGVGVTSQQSLAIATELELDALLATDQIDHPPQPKLYVVK